MQAGNLLNDFEVFIDVVLSQIKMQAIKYLLVLQSKQLRIC